MVGRALALLLLLTPVAGRAQVRDGFEDGDFSANPPWTGDGAHWRVVSRAGGQWLNTAGAAESDTLVLATPSHVSYGTWRFVFAHEGVNLSNANGTRVYLAASTPDLRGAVQGYFLQLGTNNSDEVRLYRQDGAPDVAANRVELGRSAPLLPGDAGTYAFEVTRIPDGTWTVKLDGTSVLTARDTLYRRATHFGFWVKHSSAAAASYFFDSVDVDGTEGPPDTSPPRIVADAYTDALPGFVLDVSEPLDPASVQPGAFTLSNGAPAAPALSANALRVELRLGAPLPDGDYTLAVRGLRDAAGNAMPDTLLRYTLTRDTTPPTLASVAPLSPSALFVRFSEPVTNGCDPSRYSISPPDASVTGVSCPPGTTTDTLRLALNAPLVPGPTYTLTATSLADAAGNVQTLTTALFALPETAVAGDLVVNEVMYAPPAGVPEYVEIFNRSAKTLDLGRVTLADATGAPRVLSDAPFLLTPGGYAVATRDSSALVQLFGPLPVLQPTAWPTLNNDADAVVLTSEGVRLDSLTYTAAWGGAGVSLERRDPAGPSTSRANWGSSADGRGGTPGAQNSLFAPDRQGPRVVQAEEVQPALLAVRFSEGIDPTSLSATTFTLDAGQPTRVQLTDADRVEIGFTPSALPTALTVRGVRDLTGNAGRDTTVALAFLPRPGELVVHEILYAPLALPDDNRPDQPEFVELYNAGARLLTLSLLRVVGAPDEKGVADTLRLPSALPPLPPGGYAVLYDADDTDGDPARDSRLARAFPEADLSRPGVVLVPLATVTRGGLSNNGERLRLVSGTTVVDEVDYQPGWHDGALVSTTGRSLERIHADAPAQSALNWATSATSTGATPGLPNSAAPIVGARTPQPGDVVVTEILYQPRADPRDGLADQTEYVEVFSRSANLLDLNGLTLLDAPDETGDADTTRLVFRPTALTPGGYAVFYRLNGPYATAADPDALFVQAFPGAEGGVRVPQRLAGFSLPDTGRRLRLHAPEGALLDEVAYSPRLHTPSLRETAGVSLERISPDVAADEPSNWSSSAAPAGGTPGRRNSLTLDPDEAGVPARPGLSVAPSPFSPDGDGLDDHATLTFRLGSAAASIRVRVFDQSGRLVRTLAQAQPAGAAGQVVWDGRDDSGRALRLGIYVVVLEALDAGAGSVETYRAPVVLARPLG